MTRFRHNLPGEDLGKPPITHKPIQWIGVPPPKGRIMRLLRWAEAEPVKALGWLAAAGTVLLIGLGMLIGAFLW